VYSHAILANLHRHLFNLTNTVS